SDLDAGMDGGQAQSPTWSHAPLRNRSRPKRLWSRILQGTVTYPVTSRPTYITWERRSLDPTTHDPFITGITELEFDVSAATTKTVVEEPTIPLNHTRSGTPPFSTTPESSGKTAGQRSST